MSEIVELNVGGKLFMTQRSTFLRFKDSALAPLVHGKPDDKMSGGDGNDSKLQILMDENNRYFIDFDPLLFRYILDFLRTGSLILPEQFNENFRLLEAAKIFKLSDLVSSLENNMPAQPEIRLVPQAATATAEEAATKLCGSKKTSEGSTKPKGFITLGYRGTFTSGRGDLADVKFRKLNRILICGRVGLCREAFGDTLNETRDPDRGSEDRYSARLFLKHSSLEKAFEMLSLAGFKLVSSAGTAASKGLLADGSRRASLVGPPGLLSLSPQKYQNRSTKKASPQPPTINFPSDELSGLSWDHYCEFYFQRS